MLLRGNPKQTINPEAGPVRNSKIAHAKIRERNKYLFRIEKQSAIEANMLRLLTIAAIDNPALHLNFWQENLKSDYPVIEIRRSNLIDGGLGIFVTDNCIFLPSGLMYLPNVTQIPRDQPAEEGTEMYNYQFAIYSGRRLSYIFPTLEPNATLPCAQFINTPRRKTQGYYSEGVDPLCKQAMHIGNVSLLGKYPGGFRGHQVIYPGFEILGPYASSYRLPTVDDYCQRRKHYSREWQKETKEAFDGERKWLKEIKDKNRTKIEYWKGVASSMQPRILLDRPMTTIGDFIEFEDDSDSEFQLFWECKKKNRK